jgi:hypothetical protein
VAWLPHEDSVLSVDVDNVDNVDAAYALAQATGLLPDYDKCQAYIADVHSAFRSGS